MIWDLVPAIVILTDGSDLLDVDAPAEHVGSDENLLQALPVSVQHLTECGRNRYSISKPCKLLT